MSSPLAHASVAVLGKAIVRKSPLWLFLLATQIPDLSPIGVKFALALEVIGVIGILTYVMTYFLKKKKAKSQSKEQRAQ